MKNKISPYLMAMIITFMLLATGYLQTRSINQKPAEITLSNQQPLTLTASHNGTIAVVQRVIDGDTIELATGERVRYIGINAPELNNENSCFGDQAKEENARLVEGKMVELEKDISETDKYDRLLRYVWINEELINETLVKQGYAHSSTFPPDVKYQQIFITADKYGRSQNLGLWDKCE